MIRLHPTAARILVPALLFTAGSGAAASGAEASSFPESAVLPTPAVADFSPVVSAPAHELGQSYMFLRVYDDSLVVRLEITLEDLERVLAFGWDLEAVTVEEILERSDSVRAYVEPRFSLSSASGPLDAEFQRVEARYLEIADYVLLTYKIDELYGIPDEVDITWEVMFEQVRDHLNMLVIEHNWKTGTFNNEANISLIFTPRNPTQSLDLSSSSTLRGFMALVGQGVWHIWIGIDHILFLMALVLPSVLVRSGDRWEPAADFRSALIKIVTIVTFFTIAHSVTLSMAALELVRLPSRLVESIIAASIAAAAWANLVPRLNVREWSIAFVFGLFHGFGFASVLGDIGLGREYLVHSLLGFNIGVELGQIAVVVATFPVLFVLRRTRAYRWSMTVGSLLLIGVALYWGLERALDVDIPLRAIVTSPFTWLISLVSGGS